MKIVFANVRRRLPHFDLECDFELSGSRFAFVGPSGAGKTTAVELVAGLRRPDTGQVVLDDRVLSGSGTGETVPIADRMIGYAPQDDAIFPHLSVERNVRFAPPHPTGISFEEDDVFSALDLEPLFSQRVARLSGGERRRVALARALLSSPGLLLLDEPFAGLDEKLRRRAIDLLDRYQRTTAVPWILVSHDASDIEALASTVVEFEMGRTRVRS